MYGKAFVEWSIPRFVCRFFLAISALRTHPRSISTLRPLSVSFAATASATVANFAKPIICFLGSSYSLETAGILSTAASKPVPQKANILTNLRYPEHTRAPAYLQGSPQQRWSTPSLHPGLKWAYGHTDGCHHGLFLTLCVQDTDF